MRLAPRPLASVRPGDLIDTRGGLFEVIERRGDLLLVRRRMYWWLGWLRPKLVRAAIRVLGSERYKRWVHGL